MLVLYILSVILQFVLTYKYFWRYKSIISLLSLIIFGFTASYFFFTSPNLLTFAEFFFAGFLVLNLARIFAGKSNERYLYTVSRSTTLILLPIQFILTLNKDFDSNVDSYQVFAIIALLFSVLILAQIIKNIIKFKSNLLPQIQESNKLPTLTVAIPARNETPELFDCLSSIVASNYPKLEIIVLDDCSQDKTAEIIKQFAQSGVRFVKGEEPDLLWLPKNQAYEHLVNESNGEFIFFCNADIRLDQNALTQLVSKAISQNKSMICVEPLQSSTSPLSRLLMPLQNWWELILPRKLINRPATTSSAWLVNRKQLIMLGGFRAVSRALFPEKFFAQKFIHNNGYTYMIASNNSVVETSKKFREKIYRAIRNKYPTYHRRLELIAFSSLFYVLVFIYPFYEIGRSLFYGLGLITAMCISALILLNVSNILILKRVIYKWHWQYIFSFPFSAILDLAITNVSAYKYEFGTVNWKDRNICLPVMHRTSQLVDSAGADKLGM